MKAIIYPALFLGLLCALALPLFADTYPNPEFGPTGADNMNLLTITHSSGQAIQMPAGGTVQIVNAATGEPVPDLEVRISPNAGTWHNKIEIFVTGNGSFPSDAKVKISPSISSSGTGGHLVGGFSQLPPS